MTQDKETMKSFLSRYLFYALPAANLAEPLPVADRPAAIDP
jgi:hypothetical protein